jgi:hypothetical protein
MKYRKEFFTLAIVTHHIINYFCTYYIKNTMSHHPKAEKDNLNYIYYLVGILSGIFVGFIANVSYVYVLVGAVLGFLSAAAFVNVLAKSSEEA